VATANHRIDHRRYESNNKLCKFAVIDGICNLPTTSQLKCRCFT